MPVAKPTTVPRWSSASPGTTTVTPPANTAAIPNWAPGPFTPGSLTMKGGNEYVVISIAGTGTSTTGPSGTSNPVPIDNPGANQVQWGWVATVPTTQDSGFQPNTQPPAQYFNWLFYWIYQWILWLQDIANQNFTSSSVGPWTGLHSFTGGSGAIPPVVVSASGGFGAAGVNSTGASNPFGDPGAGLIANGGTASPGTGADGCQGNGTGTGFGARFMGGTDGTSGGGIGCYAKGGPSAPGASFEGGAIPSGGGSAGPGMSVVGGAGREGANFSGGAGDTNGVICTSNSTSAPAVLAVQLGSGPALGGMSVGSGPAVKGVGGTGPAIEANDGGVSFTGTQTRSPPANTMVAGLTPKALLILSINSFGVNIIKQVNVVTTGPNVPQIVNIAGNDAIQISFTTAMADPNWGFTFGVQENYPPAHSHTMTTNTGSGNTTTQGQFQIWRHTATGTVIESPLSAFVGIVTIIVWGDQ